MDRFIVDILDFTFSVSENLKSNMDRFIDKTAAAHTSPMVI